MRDLNKQFINDKELEFVIFCIENIAYRLGISGDNVYQLLIDYNDILNNYIIPCYESLHTQDKDYIINDILNVMKEAGIKI